MNSKKARNFRIFGWMAALAVLLQTIGLIRYINRLPEDWVGIMLYAITLLAFIAASAGAFLEARKDEI
jgi:hypothetical protein